MILGLPGTKGAEGTGTETTQANACDRIAPSKPAMSGPFWTGRGNRRDAHRSFQSARRRLKMEAKTAGAGVA
jgi:hypothetical protein